MFEWLRKTQPKKAELATREDALRRELLEGGSKNRKSEDAAKAVAYCEMCIAEYEWWFEWNEARWNRWQQVAIISGVIATLAGVITIPYSWVSWSPALTSSLPSLSWLRGVPAAIATIATSYLASFTFREDAVRHEVTANAMWNELAKYQVKAAPYNVTDAVDTSLFMNIICSIVDSELRDWSSLVARLGTKSDKTRDPDSDSGRPSGTATAAPPKTATLRKFKRFRKRGAAMAAS
jgi:hypothetical protein